jgi:hypothetical protein
MKTAFQLADRYIALRSKCAPQSWGDAVLRLNELVLGPLIALCMTFLGKHDLFALASAAMATYRSWSDWLEYDDLRFQMQQMYLDTLLLGGPFIRTNDPTYLPYVYADAVTRKAEGMLTPGMPRQDSAPGRPPVL